jgi:ABC-2 type transport system permease protein
MAKAWVIAWKELRTRFTDRNLLLIMLAAPLAISTIIGLAFGGLGRNSSPIRDIPVAVVNHDLGNKQGIAFGAVLTDLLVTGELAADDVPASPDCPATTAGQSESDGQSVPLGDLINGWTFDRAAAEALIGQGQIEAPAADLGEESGLDQAARSAVDNGLATAAVIIPAGFSEALASLAMSNQESVPVEVQVYGNQGSGLTAGIVRSVVDSIVNQMASGNVAIGATMGELAARDPASLATLGDVDFGRLFSCAFMPTSDLIELVNQPVQPAQNSVAGAILVAFGSAQAMFFALFTGQSGILSMYEERRTWTLQRLLISPTPRWSILTGKLIGVLTSVLAQLLMLVVALTLVGSLIAGKLTMIWGTNLPLLGLTLLAAAVSVSGLGMLLAGVLRGIEQANVVGSVLNIALGVLGGGFGFQLPRSIASFSIVYWGRDAFDMLAAGHGDIATNLLVLFGQGLIMFAIGLFLFNRRFEA